MFSSRLAGALGRAAVINSRAFIARWLAGVLNDASFREGAGRLRDAIAEEQRRTDVGAELESVASR